MDADFDFDGDEGDEEDYDDLGYYQDEDVDAIEDHATNACERSVVQSLPLPPPLMV